MMFKFLIQLKYMCIYNQLVVFYYLRSLYDITYIGMLQWFKSDYKILGLW